MLPFVRVKRNLPVWALCNTTKMKRSINKELLQRFLNKENSQTENDEILQWASSSDKNREELRMMHQSFYAGALKKDLSEIDIEKAWTSLYLKMPKASVKGMFIRLDVLRKIAASVLILFTIGFGGLWVNEHYFVHAKSAMIKLETPKGEKSKVLLADGTQVWLNSQTILKYDALEPRNITMDGEAYFEVVKNPKHPFVVTTPSGMKVTVLGTKFNLRNYSGEPVMETTLEEGRVMISGIEKYKPVYLNPGEQAIYHGSENRLQVKQVNPEVYSLWRNNELRFSNVSFRELIPRIERWYGVTVDLDPTVVNTDRFTMTVKTESLHELLQMMQLTSKFNYEIKGERVAIKAK